MLHVNIVRIMLAVRFENLFDGRSFPTCSFMPMKGVHSMQVYLRVCCISLLSFATATFVGCGGTGSPVPAGSSASSEAADAAGGVNKIEKKDASASTTGDAKQDTTATEAPAKETEDASKEKTEPSKKDEK
jgi:hypothetical protein